ARGRHRLTGTAHPAHGPHGIRRRHTGSIECTASPLPPLPTMSDAPIFRSGPKACCAILLALALVACGAGGGAESQGAVPPAVVVTTAVVSTQPFNDRIRALGTVKAREAV